MIFDILHFNLLKVFFKRNNSVNDYWSLEEILGDFTVSEATRQKNNHIVFSSLGAALKIRN